jgi:hypothetical protein
VAKIALGSTDGQEAAAAIGPWLITQINVYCIDATPISGVPSKIELARSFRFRSTSSAYSWFLTNLGILQTRVSHQ